MSTYNICYCFRLRYRPASNDPSEGLKKVFKEYTSEDGVMGLEQLQQFMSKVQEEENATEAAQAVLDRSKEIIRLPKRKGLSQAAFFRYLSSDDNSPILLPRIHQDMTAPLSHYFIFTGHNSYLTGNQLTSNCSDKPIRNALIKGVRGIELDVWPNANHDDINVLHGRTLTAPVKLIDCLKTIREHAFVSSPYPVIITLEDHLNTDLRAKLTSMMNNIFRDLLYVPNGEHIESFPSPEDLKMKILVSTKPPELILEETKIATGTEHGVPTEDDPWGQEISHPKHEIPDGDTVVEHEQSAHYQDEEEHDEAEQKPHEAADYRHLIAIPARKKKGELKDAIKADCEHVGRLSLSEQVFEKATVHHGSEIIRFTKRNLLRIYPRATRFSSSNYNPMHGWMYGAQMVALNMQGCGRSLWVMQGMFRANGGSGYVKKPDFLLHTEEDHVFHPRAELPVKIILKVKVFMGDGWRFDFTKTYFDRFSPPDFYARVGIAGVPADSKMENTNPIEDDWTPMWDKEFEFKLRVPELAVLRIEVHEYDMSDKDDFAGQTCLPVWELRNGIRAVRLCDRKGDLLHSVRLLMQFEKIIV